MEYNKEWLYYFAHPYTGNEKNNYVLANHRMAKLIELGLKVYSPITMTHPLDEIVDKPHDFWMEFNQPFLEHADALIVAPDFQYSNGCIREYAYFTRAQKPIFNYEEMISESNDR